MAIDTRDKRSSAVNITLPWRGLYPAPDGALDQADRQHVALLYRGISAAAGGAPAATANQRLFTRNVGRLLKP